MSGDDLFVLRDPMAVTQDNWRQGRGQAPLKEVNEVIKEYWNKPITPEMLADINDRLFTMGYETYVGADLELKLRCLPLRREIPPGKPYVKEEGVRGPAGGSKVDVEWKDLASKPTVLRYFKNGEPTSLIDKDLKKRVDFNKYGLLQEQLDFILECQPTWTVHHETVRQEQSRYAEFLDKFEPGDELWDYSNTIALSGTSGKLILRGSKVVAIHVIFRS